MPMMDELLLYLLIGAASLHLPLDIFYYCGLFSCLISTSWVYFCRVSVMLNNKCYILTEEN